MEQSSQRLHLTTSLHGDVTYRDSISNVPGDYTVAFKNVLTHHRTSGYARELLNVRWLSTFMIQVGTERSISWKSSKHVQRIAARND